MAWQCVLYSEALWQERSMFDRSFCGIFNLIVPFGIFYLPLKSPGNYFQCWHFRWCSSDLWSSSGVNPGPCIIPLSHAPFFNPSSILLFCWGHPLKKDNSITCLSPKMSYVTVQVRKLSLSSSNYNGSKGIREVTEWRRKRLAWINKSVKHFNMNDLIVFCFQPNTVFVKSLAQFFHKLYHLFIIVTVAVCAPLNVLKCWFSIMRRSPANLFIWFTHSHTLAHLDDEALYIVCMCVFVWG